MEYSHRDILNFLMMPGFSTNTEVTEFSGRGVGMEKHYADWFERILPDTLSVRDRFTVSDELVYLVERT